ncbi:hypothetical protein SRHO_G00276340 [Serrasalmus rhombeus]
MITGQLSKPLLPLRAEMEGAELQEDERAASPDSETNDEPLLLPPDADDNDKLYVAEAAVVAITFDLQSRLVQAGIGELRAVPGANWGAGWGLATVQSVLGQRP